jgi:trans-2,3-dihydro-3-hydroxyanthranilate isomerase
MKAQARRFAFIHLDVFTSRALEGNQLAVFTDARGLSDAEMQALAKEMNLSETTFIVPGDPQVEARDGVRVRIFTVEEELDFAGHPTLGTASVIRDRMFAAEGGDMKRPAEVTLALRVGRIPVSFSTDAQARIFGEMRQRDPEFGPVRPREEVARATGLKLDDIDPNLPIQTVSTGLPFTMVPLARSETLRNLQFSYATAEPYLTQSGGRFFYFVTRDTAALGGEAKGARLEARMIFYNGEDPATGSAAGCCASWMVRHGVAKSEEQVLIAQGLRIHRPSYLHVRARLAGETGTDVRVGGNTVEVMRGEVIL